MAEALKEAHRSLEKGEVPVGAVVVQGNRILGRGHNETVMKCDPTAHAEILALRRAAKKRKNHRLTDCVLYVTLEPCAMCLGAAVQARIKRLVYGAKDPKSGAVESIMFFPFDKTNHVLSTQGGILAGECGRILSRFFQERR
ncbi:MAG: nucleoside deaminase [Candidatus Aminicenantes bacterium]|nr:nucleoside deaminase [Candidatus Aminicenantes bacterium]